MPIISSLEWPHNTYFYHCASYTKDHAWVYKYQRLQLYLACNGLKYIKNHTPLLIVPFDLLTAAHSGMRLQL